MTHLFLKFWILLVRVIWKDCVWVELARMMQLCVGFTQVIFLISVQYDQDYYPGRRKRGKDYEEGMVR